jgi:hypothetical protein
MSHVVHIVIFFRDAKLDRYRGVADFEQASPVQFG